MTSTSDPTDHTDHTDHTDDTEGSRHDELTYEQARDELAEVVRALEGGGTSLAESLQLWERGEHLARVCQDALEGARTRLDRALGAQDQG